MPQNESNDVTEALQESFLHAGALDSGVQRVLSYQQRGISVNVPRKAEERPVVLTIDTLSSRGTGHER